MLYIALICIAAGLMLLLLPLVFRVEKRPCPHAENGYDRDRGYPPAGSAVKPADVRRGDPNAGMERRNAGDDDGLFAGRDRAYRIDDELPDIAHFGSTGPDAPAAANEPADEGIFNELERELDDIMPEETEGEGGGEASGASAVLFDDEAGAFDLDAAAGSPDPGAIDFTRFRRIGRGRLEEVRDGLNFHIGKTFYRFDFHRIERVRAGEHFLALKLKGATNVRIFLFDKPTSYADEIARSVGSYHDGTGNDVLSI